MDGLPGGARLALLAIIAVLLVTLGFLLALAFLGRRQNSRDASLADVVGGGAPDGDAGDAAVEASTRACPSCGGEYAGGLLYCPRDARRLVDAGDASGHSAGWMCPRCQRGFEAGVRRCPDDGCDLVPAVLMSVPSVPATDDPTVAGKICPRCRRRHALSASFCGRDGSPLVALN